MMAPDDFEDLFDNAPCGYLSLHPDGRIAMANAAVGAWTGCRPEQLVGKRIHDIVTFSTKIFLETQVFPLLRMQGSVSDVTLDLATPEGGKVPTRIHATECRDTTGRHLSTRMILLKAVDRRKYERELASAKNEAEQAVAIEREAAVMREQFIAVLGHDLRNPLASIGGGVRMLGKDVVSERGKRILGLMEGSVVRASALIENVLDFARGRLGGGLTLSAERDVPLEAVLGQVIAELRSIAPERTIEVDIAIDRPVDCDPTRLGQLVSNLLGNALTHGASDEPVRVACSTRDDRLKIAIANGGSPIPAETLARLFQPFFRGGSGSKGDGLGLGLYIASQIAKAHGGELVATSCDIETRFTFLMPLGPV